MTPPKEHPIALTSIPAMQAEQGTSKRRAGARTQSGESDSRQRVIDAATACILDQGFYRASSNAIAERAGVSWGVIQYHFGSREALMLAVLEEGTRRLNETLVTAEITGSTVTERVAQYADILARYYGCPEFLAYTQVLINLAHDPRTSEQTRATMARIAESASPEMEAQALRKPGPGSGGPCWPTGAASPD